MIRTIVILAALALAPFFVFGASTKEMKCLASAIYHEARGEPVSGQLAVAYTILTRQADRNHPSTVCKVVFAPNQFTGLRRLKYEQEHLELAKYASMVYRLSRKKPKFTHFHTIHVNPKWASAPNMIRVARFGAHIFYREG